MIEFKPQNAECSETLMEWSNLMETLVILLACVVMPSAVAMYFSAPPNADSRN